MAKRALKALKAQTENLLNPQLKALERSLKVFKLNEKAFET